MKFNEYLLNIMSYMMLGSSLAFFFCISFLITILTLTIYWKQEKVTSIVLKTFGLFFSL